VNKGEPNNDRNDQDTENINNIDVPNNNKKPLTYNGENRQVELAHSLYVSGVPIK